MKVVVAAAGKGTRMKELGFDKPKHLLEVHGRPFLEYLLNNIKEAGFTDIIVVGGYKIEKVQEFLNKYDKDIVLVNQREKIKDERYGTTPPIEAVVDLIKNEEFIFLSGDNLYAPEDLKKLGDCEGFNCLGAHISDHPELYGVIQKNNKGGLEKIVEKPLNEIGKQISIGAYRFTPDIIKEIKKVDESERGEYELVDAVNMLAQKKPVKVVEFKKYWFDFGKPEDINILEDFLDEEHIK
ncbi:NTP transferase domain-containing protein [Patescibacteria group bacterium]|nr:NTP transferase domain-containing protein [Patescibacteria group bacterium]MBU1673308.1 NTP transferase domain-containing protein [Patescibacteria group bacterium]MBU1963573.1 NTP transferase domain-containing protein [Patescibacteria group bacterium]